MDKAIIIIIERLWPECAYTAATFPFKRIIGQKTRPPSTDSGSLDISLRPRFDPRRLSNGCRQRSRQTPNTSTHTQHTLLPAGLSLSLHYPIACCSRSTVTPSRAASQGQPFYAFPESRKVLTPLHLSMGRERDRGRHSPASSLLSSPIRSHDIWATFGPLLSRSILPTTVL